MSWAGSIEQTRGVVGQRNLVGLVGAPWNMGANKMRARGAVAGKDIRWWRDGHVATIIKARGASRWRGTVGRTPDRSQGAGVGPHSIVRHKITNRQVMGHPARVGQSADPTIEMNAR